MDKVNKSQVTNSFNCISSALNKANLKGSFTLKESFSIHHSLILVKKIIESINLEEDKVKINNSLVENII